MEKKIINLDNLPSGYIRHDECLVLANIASYIPSNGLIVEVGSFLGKSAVIFARHTKDTVKIICVDLFSDDFRIDVPTTGYEINQTVDTYKTFLENTSEYKNIITIKADNPKQLNFIDQIDMLFLDASHCNPSDKDYLIYFDPLVKKNGIIVGHDYGEMFPDVIENVEMLEEMYNTKAIFPGGTLWMIRKP